MLDGDGLSLSNETAKPRRDTRQTDSGVAIERDRQRPPKLRGRGTHGRQRFEQGDSGLPQGARVGRAQRRHGGARQQLGATIVRPPRQHVIRPQIAISEPDGDRGTSDRAHPGAAQRVAIGSRWDSGACGHGQSIARLAGGRGVTRHVRAWSIQTFRMGAGILDTGIAYAVASSGGRASIAIAMTSPFRSIGPPLNPLMN
jgi:hypothetical protein